MHFPATELAVGIAILLGLGAGVGCERSTGGIAVRTSGAAPSTTSAAPTLSDPAEPVPGVESTLPDHIPPNAVVCFPRPAASGTMTVASVPDPVAPVITLPVPDGRKSARGSGDVALTAPGPAGMSVRVTITPTDLEAGPGGVAFADRITHVWTNTRSFLVVIHLEGPVGAPGFDAAKSTTMQQFAVVIP